MLAPHSKTTKAKKCGSHKNVVCKKRHRLCWTEGLERGLGGEKRRGKRKDGARGRGAEDKRGVVDYSVCF